MGVPKGAPMPAFCLSGGSPTEFNMQVRSTHLRVLIADTDCHRVAGPGGQRVSRGNEVLGVACLAAQLEYWGHEVYAAADGGAALAALRVFRPDVLLLSLNLPGLDALSVVMTVRRERACQPLLIVALTAE